MNTRFEYTVPTAEAVEIKMHGHILTTSGDIPSREGLDDYPVNEEQNW